MKQPSSPKPRRRRSDLEAEYRFDYSASRPNRFAVHAGSGVVAILLDPDVATVFHDSESVNALLRSVITAMPGGPAPKARAARRPATAAAGASQR